MLEHLGTNVCHRNRIASESHQNPNTTSNSNAEEIRPNIFSSNESYSEVNKTEAADSMHVVRTIENLDIKSASQDTNTLDRCNVDLATTHPTLPSSSATEITMKTGYTPTIVPDSPVPFAPDTGLALPMLDYEDELEKFVIDAENTTTLAEAADTSNPRPATAEREINLFNTSEVPRRFYRMTLGSQCALCLKELGSDIGAVFQHAKSHFEKQSQLNFTCTTCWTSFAYELDFRLHSRKLEQWSICRGTPIEPFGENDWLTKADQKDRDLFIELLRRWESLQLRWYLRAIQSLLTREHLRVICRESAKTESSAKIKRSKAPRSAHTAPANVSLETRSDALTVTKTFQQEHFFDPGIFPVSEVCRLSFDQVDWIFTRHILWKGSRGEPCVYEQPLAEIRQRYKNDVDYQWALGLVLKAAVVCSWGGSVLVRKLLAMGTDVETRDDAGYSPLLHAVLRGKQQIAVTLLDGGADILQTLRDGTSVLHLACMSQYPDFVRMLLRNGAEVDATDSQSCTPLMRISELRAPIEDHLRVAALLSNVKYHVNPHSTKPTLVLADTWHVPPGPLELEGTSTCLQIIQILLDHGANIDACDTSGRTALMLATIAGYADSVKALLARGANASIKDNSGMDVFLWSERFQHTRHGTVTTVLRT